MYVNKRRIIYEIKKIYSINTSNNDYSGFNNMYYVYSKKCNCKIRNKK